MSRVTMGWANAYNSEVLRFWPSAADIGHEELDDLLTSAAIQCDAYGPQITYLDVDGVTVLEGAAPANYLHAQVLQARALYRSGMAGTNDQIGIDGQAVTVFPMDWTVKALLRPKRGPWVR